MNMKKYKLIKKYPVSPAVGTIKYISNHPLSNGHIEVDGRLINPNDYPEFWEEVVEKDYETLLYENIHSGGKCKPKDVYNPNHFKIYSVKRLSDGEIFTVGDFVDCKNWFGKIIKFETIEEKIKVFQQQNIDSIKYKPYDLDIVKKNKKPLFTTEDGVDIFKSDQYFWISSKNNKEICSSFAFDNSKDGKRNVLYFSTKEAAEEYILMNKPCLSLNDVFKIYPRYKKQYKINTKHAEDLIKIVKSKL